MSSKVLLLVEGQTEVAFVKQVMKPAMPGLSLVPIAVTTRITADGSHKGGLVTYASFRRQVLRLLGGQLRRHGNITDRLPGIAP